MDKPKNLTNEEISLAMNSFSNEVKSHTGTFPVLIIDDDTWIQRIICHYLQSWGFKTISALDAFDGIALAIKHRPIMVMLDIVMPEVNGDILLKMFKKIDLTKDIPILIISSNLNHDVLGNTYKSGAAGFISKPFSQQILFEKVRDCLGPSMFQTIKPENLETPPIENDIKEIDDTNEAKEA